MKYMIKNDETEPCSWIAYITVSSYLANLFHAHPCTDHYIRVLMVNVMSCIYSGCLLYVFKKMSSD